MRYVINGTLTHIKTTKINEGQYAHLLTITRGNATWSFVEYSSSELPTSKSLAGKNVMLVWRLSTVSSGKPVQYTSRPVVVRIVEEPWPRRDQAQAGDGEDPF